YSTTVNFIDDNIGPDFSETPPIPTNPFASGSAVGSITITAPGAYTTIPSITLAAPGSGGVQATGYVVAGVVSAAVNTSQPGFQVGDTLTQSPNTNGIVLQVL